MGNRVQIHTDKYPEQLARVMGRKAPRQLHYRGNLDLISRKAVGVSGSRRVSEAGRHYAGAYAAELACGGWTIVSGYATGVDMASHHAALAAGGTTVIVLPEGIGQWRLKPELEAVWDWNRALVVSQFEPTDPFRAYQAIKRNAVIAALSRAVLVVEAGEKGGTLNTGLTALELGVPIYVPSYTGLPQTATGNQQLVARGARQLHTDRDRLDENIRQMTEAMNRPTASAYQPSLFTELACA